jgi:hypothetical protein
MVTVATLRNRLEALKQGPDMQEFKIFFVDGGSDKALTEAQWETVRTWEKTHPWGRAHVIIFEEVEGR